MQDFYDRVEILVDGIPYLANGLIRNFEARTRYNTRIVSGMSPNGLATGKTVGNTMVELVRWEEYLTDQNDFIEWNSFLIANPNAIITVIPVSLVNGVPNAPQFAIVGLNPTDVSIVAAGEGQEMVRNCSFNAVSMSNT